MKGRDASGLSAGGEARLTPLYMVNFVHRMTAAYDRYCQSVCRQMQIGRTAFDIVMFLANNPRYNTARDISQYRWIKPNLVSFTVDKLVKEGFLQRHPVPGDRRKVRLSCTEKAMEMVRMGHRMQADFLRALTAGLNEAEIQQFEGYMQRVQENMEAMFPEE